MTERVQRELEILKRGGQSATLVSGNPGYVVYEEVPVLGSQPGLPLKTSVIVPIPNGYPAAAIDLAGLPAGSPLMPLVAGGTNPQGTVSVMGTEWQFASYHPHANGGGPAWDQSEHGFHTYLDHILAWLGRAVL